MFDSNRSDSIREIIKKKREPIYIYKKNEPLVFFFWGDRSFRIQSIYRERVCLFIHILLHSLPTLLF